MTGQRIHRRHQGTPLRAAQGLLRGRSADAEITRVLSRSICRKRGGVIGSHYGVCQESSVPGSGGVRTSHQFELASRQPRSASVSQQLPCAGISPVDEPAIPGTVVAFHVIDPQERCLRRRLNGFGDARSAATAHSHPFSPVKTAKHRSDSPRQRSCVAEHFGSVGRSSGDRSAT
jgi:hypothetical protein